MAFGLSPETREPGLRLENKGQEAGIGGQEPIDEGPLKARAKHCYNYHERL